MGDWLLLVILVAIFLGNGVYVWHAMGAASATGRAIFFGLLLLCVLWAAIVYTFKLSVCVRVGPQGLSVVRGPWRTELAWRDVARLTERSQLREGQRFRWLVALARDGRRMQIRDDMVLDYQRFRVEVYERYRLWNDHGGTWGTTGGGPYSAREMLPGQTTWWAVGAAALGLPGIYFWALLPETNPLGLALVVVAVVCGTMSARGALRRQAYTVDGKTITVRRPFRTVHLTWREVARVERTRTPFGGAIRVAIGAGQVALKLAARTDGRVESFDWSPRIPEYLILRGAGHLARIRLHRLERPDEMLAWVEFYDNIARHAAESAPRRTGAPAAALASLPAPQPAKTPADLTTAAGPIDPWGAGRGGAMERQAAEEAGAPTHEGQRTPAEPQAPAASTERAMPTLPTAPTIVTTPGDSWLRAEPHRPADGPSWQPRQRVQEQQSPAAGQAERQAGTGGEAEAETPPASVSASRPWWQTPHAASAAWRQEPVEQEQPQWAVEQHQQQQPQWGQPAQQVGQQSAWPVQQQQQQQQRPFEPARWPSPEAAQPAQPAPHATQEPWSEPAAYYGRGQDQYGGARAERGGFGEWVPDEVAPEAAEDAPTDSVESLAESFAAWREDAHRDANWQRPPLPRFGPEREE